MDDHERRCARCGGCCGALDGDPYVELVKDAAGSYYCKIYAVSLGVQKTTFRREFTCVPIRDNIKKGAIYKDCAYNK